MSDRLVTATQLQLTIQAIINEVNSALTAEFPLARFNSQLIFTHDSGYIKVIDHTRGGTGTPYVYDFDFDSDMRIIIDEFIAYLKGTSFGKKK